jgi:hypothetical protein
MGPRNGSDGRDFAVREHSAMQAKLDSASEDIYRAEVVVPVAIAAVYVWLVSHPEIGPPWLYLVPPFLAVAGGLRYLARLVYVRTAEEYVRRLERKLRARDYPQGWEHFYQGKLKWYWLIRLAFWTLLIGATSYIATAKILCPEMLV